MGKIAEIGTKQKALQGHSRFIKNTPDVKPINRMWPTPGDLNEAGKALWEEQGSLLTKARVLTDLDKPTFLLLCRCLDVVTQADATLGEEGLTISNRDGERAHPAIKARKDAVADFIRLSEKFGLSPYDRNKLDLRVDSQPDDKMRRFLFGKNK